MAISGTATTIALHLRDTGCQTHPGTSIPTSPAWIKTLKPMPRQNYVLFFSRVTLVYFKKGLATLSELMCRRRFGCWHETFTLYLFLHYLNAVTHCVHLLMKRVYSQLPNLRGQAWASIGKSSSCMGHSADIVSLKEEVVHQRANWDIIIMITLFTNDPLIINNLFPLGRASFCIQPLTNENHSRSPLVCLR